MKGITLLEIIIAIAILALLAVLLIQPLSSFRDEQLLVGHSERVLSLLQEARSNTLASRNASQYGVHFATTSAVLFEGETFAAATSTLKDVSFHSRIVFGSISLAGGGSEVIFERLTGSTAHSGSLVLQLKTSTTSTRTIVVDSTGVASINE